MAWYASARRGMLGPASIAREMLAEVRDSIQGMQVSAPFGKVPLALEVFQDSLKAPRPVAAPKV